MHYPSHKTKGAALVTALFITALVALLSWLILDRIAIATHRTLLITTATEADNYARFGLLSAIDQLNRNVLIGNTIGDTLPLHSIVKKDNVLIETDISDEESKLNLNNLHDPNCQGIFTRLIKYLEPEMNDADIKQLIFVILKTTKQSPFVTPYELQALNISPVLFTKLLPFITALPNSSLLNLRSAPLPILMSLSPSITSETAKNIMDLQTTHTQNDNEKLAQLIAMNNYNLPVNIITLLSHFFLVRIDVTIDKNHFTKTLLVNRNFDQEKSTCKILWQTTGV